MSNKVTKTFKKKKTKVNVKTRRTGNRKTKNNKSKEQVNFASTPSKHMENKGRYVPVQILKEAIKSGIATPDPRGSKAMMYYTTMYRNGKKYNLEVLYDKSTNTILHFEYARKAMGSLPKISK